MARLAQVRAAYGAPELIATPNAFFVPPPPIVPALRRVADLGDAGQVADASWPSTSVPYLEAIRAAYLAYEENRTAHARVYLAKEPRPAVVLIHGYLGGSWSTEGLAWPIEWMGRWGLDVAIPLLPFHALRGEPDGRPPPFPGPDPRFTNEGFHQAVADIRALIGWLRARGAPAVGVMGMSLGATRRRCSRRSRRVSRSRSPSFRSRRSPTSRATRVAWAWASRRRSSTARWRTRTGS